MLWRRVPKPTVVQPVLPLDNSETIWFPAEDLYGKTGYPNNVENTTLIKSDGVSEIQLAFSEFNFEYASDFVVILFDGHTIMFTGNYDMGLAWTGVAIGDVEIRTTTRREIRTSKTGYKLHYRKIPNNAPADITIRFTGMSCPLSLSFCPSPVHSDLRGGNFSLLLKSV